MKSRLITAVLSTGLLLETVLPAAAVTYRTPAAEARHRRHMKTLKRVGIGAAGGAVVGGLIGHGAGAGVGAVAGAGAGALYDHHKRHHPHY